MRNILRNTQQIQQQFGTYSNRSQSQSQSNNNKLSQYIQQRLENVKLENSINYLKYQQLFFKLYTNQLNRQKQTIKQLRRLDAITLVSEFPCKTIVEHFNATSKIYSEQYVVQTFVRLARAYRISQADNASTADFSINRLFFTPAFDNLIEQYKYGLKKQNAMTWQNAFLVAECLIEIGYADYEVFSLLSNMVEKSVNKRQRADREIRNFQIEKRGYYIKKTTNNFDQLVQDQEFVNVLALLKEKVNKNQIKQLHQKRLAELKEELVPKKQESTNGQDLEASANINLYNSIHETVSSIEKFSTTLNQLIEGIITVRRQYFQMVELSADKEKVLRNPQLNLQLLELQEMLLMKNLINLSDIKMPQKISNQALEVKRVQQILLQLIMNDQGQVSLGNGEITFSIQEVYDYLGYDEQITSQYEIKELKKMHRLENIRKYGTAVSVLSRFAEISRRLYNSPDGRSLVSMKWENTLINNTASKEDNDEFLENLHVDKIFRRMYGDLFKMMKRSESLFMFTFVEAPLRYKIGFCESFTRLGFHEEIIKFLQNQDLSKEKIQIYSNSQFFSLIKVLNQIGYKINSDYIKREAFKHLKKLFDNSQIQENRSLFNMEFCINAINFICQNFNVQTPDLMNFTPKSEKDQTQILYEQLLDRLAEQVKYYEECENFLTHDQLEEALRILSIEKSGSFEYTNQFYKRFGVDTSNPKELNDFLYKKNPFTFIVKEMCAKYQNPQFKGVYPFYLTGFNSFGNLTGVLVVSSQHSSIQGMNVCGNINAYITRIKRQMGIELIPLNVNSLIQFNYQKITLPSETKTPVSEFTFKSKNQIEKLLSQLFRRDDLNLLKLSQSLVKIVLVLQKHYKKSYLLGVTKFLNTLNEIINLYEKEKECISYELFKFKRYRLFLMIEELKADYYRIDKQVRDELEKMFRKNWVQSIGLKNLEISSNGELLFQTIGQIQTNVLKSISAHMAQPQKYIAKTFEGKRYTIQTIPHQENPQNSVDPKALLAMEIINNATYLDKNFCNYPSWQKAIKSLYPLEQISLQNDTKFNKSLMKQNKQKVTNLTKILVKKYLPNINFNNSSISILPYQKLQALQNPIHFTTHSLNPAVTTNKNQTDHQHHSISSSRQVQTIKQLMLFIHQLKISKTEKQLAEYILSFDFIDKLLHNHHGISSQKAEKNLTHQQLLPRNEQEYLNYLENRNRQVYKESPYLDYLFNKLQNSQELKEIFEKRKQEKIQAKLQYQLGKITPKEYFAKMEQIDDLIIQKMENYAHQNTLDAVEGKLLENGLKMFKIQKDQKELARVLNSKARFYDRYLDKDFIYVKGNTERLLRIKRNKAERNLVLTRLIWKMTLNQELALNSTEESFLKKEIDFINYRLENKKDMPEAFGQKFSNSFVSDLSQSDRKRLKLTGVDLSKCGSLALNDLVLQLVNLLDDRVCENFQKRIIAQYYSHQALTPVPVEIFSLNSHTITNKPFSQLSNLQQSAILNKSSKLNSYQMNILNQMIQTFKIQSVDGRKKYERLYSSIEEDLLMMNQSQARNQLITEYLNLKQFQFAEQYDPRLVGQVKEREVMKLWNVVFREKYDLCDGEKIRNVVGKLCDRLRVIGDNNAPPFFGLLVLKILAHPETDPLTKQNLIASIAYYKTPLKIDSEDIRQLGQDCATYEKSVGNTPENILKKIANLSQVNFMSNMQKRINMII